KVAVGSILPLRLGRTCVGEAQFRLKTSNHPHGMLKPVAMVGWSGAGKFADLERTALRKLKSSRKAADQIDGTLLVAAEDPVEVARRLAFLPGVAWISVGYRFSGNED